MMEYTDCDVCEKQIELDVGETICMDYARKHATPYYPPRETFVGI